MLSRYSSRASWIATGLLGIAFAVCQGPVRAECFATNKAEFASQKVPAVMRPGEQRCDVEVRMRNTGHRATGGSVCPTRWDSSYGYRLGSQNPANTTRWGVSKVAVSTALTPQGAEEQVFKFCITAPTAEGVYDFQWRMVQEGANRNCFTCGGCETVPGAPPEWFGARTPNVKIRVRNSGWSPATPGFPSTPQTNLVVLGDSYAAGVGLQPFDPDHHGCERSTHAFAHRISWPTAPSGSLHPFDPPYQAPWMNTSFYSCGGALTKHLLSTSFHTEPPQFSHVNEIAQADILTLTIGGNNMGFGNLASACTIRGGPTQPSCVYQSIYLDTYAAIESLYDPSKPDSLWKAYGHLDRLIRKESTNGRPPATVIAIGYPYVLPGNRLQQSCPVLTAMLLDHCEQDFVRDAIKQINVAIQSAATKTGFRFLDLRPVFEGHNICEGGEEWIQAPDIAPLTSFLHPTVQGHTAIARAVENLLATGSQTNATGRAGAPRIRKKRDGDLIGLAKLLINLGGTWCNIQPASAPGTDKASGSAMTLSASGPTTVGERQAIPDGYSDLLWRNVTTGDNVIWGMQGAAAVVGMTIPPVGDGQNWTIVGLGDFNADGFDDVVWRHQPAGATAIWYMRGTTIIGSATLPTVDSSWRLGAVNDFSGDGQPDLVWTHSTGATAIWVMNGSVATSAATLPSQADTRFQIIGSGDMNGDGSNDLIWRNAMTMDLVFWTLSGTTYTSAISFTPELVPDPSWYLGAVVDLDDDDELDLVWHNLQTGDLVAMYLHQTEYESYATMGVVDPASGWRLQGPH